MAKRKPYNSTKRLRAVVRGARIWFDGNEAHNQDARLANGMLFNQTILDYVTQYPFLWRVNITFVYSRPGMPARHVPVVICPGQAVRLDDLSEIVAAQQTLAGLDNPDGWIFKRREWCATIIE